MLCSSCICSFNQKALLTATHALVTLWLNFCNGAALDDPLGISINPGYSGMDSYQCFLLSQCNSSNSGVPNLQTMAHYLAMAYSQLGHAKGGLTQCAAQLAQVAGQCTCTCSLTCSRAAYECVCIPLATYVHVCMLIWFPPHLRQATKVSDFCSNS